MEDTLLDTTTPHKNKTLMILIFLIVMLGGGLIFMLANRQNSQESLLNTSSTTLNQPPIAQLPPTTEQLKEDRVSRVPDVVITQDQLIKQSNVLSCWTIIDGVVYDVSDISQRGKVLYANKEDVCGKDSTKIFTEEAIEQNSVDLFGPSSPYYRPIGKITQ